MGEPLESNTARSPAAAAPDVPGPVAKDGAVSSPAPPVGEAPVAKPSVKPWPTMETPLSRANGGGSLAPPPTEDWEEPATLAMPRYGGYTEDGYFTGAFDDTAPGGNGWQVDARTLEQEAGTEQADSSPLFLSRRPLYKRSEPPPTAQEQLTSVIEFLQKLQINIRKVAPEPEDTTPAALGSTLLQLRRLSRSGVVPDPFEIGVLPKPPKIEVAPPVETASESPVEEPDKPKEIPPLPDLVTPKRHHGWWLLLTTALCLIILGLATLLWTKIGTFPVIGSAARNPAPRVPSGPAPDQEVSPEAMKLANLALEEMQRGDLKKAADVLQAAQKRGVVLPGLYYQAALLALNQGDNHAADDFLEHSIKVNEAVPECWYLRANTVFFTGGPAEAADAFEQAAAAAPFHPRYYFFRAECLRRNGNAVAAVAQFQQALRCRPNSSDTELILFKIGLTKLETNTDLIFKAELRDRLAQEPVTGDTLLLAAADAISRNEFPEAAEFLKRAAVLLPPRVFQSRTRDYVYRAQAKQPDIAAALKPTLAAPPPNGQPAQRPGRTLIDPATRSMAEADPAGW